MKKGIIERNQCPVCTSKSLKTIYKKYFNEPLLTEYINIAYQGNADIDFIKTEIFEIEKCCNCNFKFQKYVLDEEKLDELYNKWIDPKLALSWRRRSLNSKKHFYIKILNLAKKQIKVRNHKIKFLDFGAGFGDALLMAKEFNFEPYAIEYSKERIAYLKQNGISVIDEMDNKTFDFIMANQVLEHITDPLRILESIVSKLSNNGLIFLAVPNCAQLEHNLKKTENIQNASDLHKAFLEANVSAFQHINFFSNSDLKLLLKESGLKLVNPLKLAFSKPINFKSIIRPYYQHFLGTSFFLQKINN